MNRVPVEENFVKKGLAAIEHELSKCHKGTAHHWACLAIPTSDYEMLLQDAFHRRPLLTGAKDESGGSKRVRFDAVKMIFLEDDGRLIVPMHSYCRYVREVTKQAEGDGECGGRVEAMTNIGDEVIRQIQAGNDDPNPLQCDEHGTYIGARVNGKMMPHNKLSQLHRSGRCLVCKSQTTKICGGCSIAKYCSVKCQRSDWMHHRHVCGHVKLNDKDEPVVTRST
jgi:hypothetical protein